MAIRVYLSNLSPAWPISRQEEMIAKELPSWPKGADVFRDILDVGERRAHRRDFLEYRTLMLRPTARRGKGETILLASLAPLAWSAEDMMECLTLALARNATVRVIDADLTIEPGCGPDVLYQAAKAFASSRKRDIEYERGRRGGAKSAQKRSATARAAAESIRAEWSLPSADFPTISLLEKAGISRNTAKLYLGPRATAQKIHQASLKRKNSAYAKRGKFRDE